MRSRPVRYLSLAISILGVQSWISMAYGQEIRTYQLIADGSLPYYVSCGECGPPMIGARADIEGTFTVNIDRQTGTGTLLNLEERLVNRFHVLASDSGTTLEPFDATEDWLSEVIPSSAWTLQPPIDGLLTIDGDTMHLASDGRRYNPDGSINSIGTSFVIEMTADRALFSMAVPIDDFAGEVTG